MDRILGDFTDSHRTVRGGDLAEQRRAELVIEPTGAGQPLPPTSSRANDPSPSSVARALQRTGDGFRTRACRGCPTGADGDSAGRQAACREVRLIDRGTGSVRASPGLLLTRTSRSLVASLILHP